MIRKERKYVDEIEILSSRTSGPISTKLDTHHHLTKGIQACSNDLKDAAHFQGEIIRNNRKYIDKILKNVII